MGTSDIYQGYKEGVGFGFLGSYLAENISQDSFLSITYFCVLSKITTPYLSSEKI